MWKVVAITLAGSMAIASPGDASRATGSLRANTALDVMLEVGNADEECKSRDSAETGTPLWCLCNRQEKKVIKTLEACENPGGDKGKYCMFDASAERCVPRQGGNAGGGESNNGLDGRSIGGCPSHSNSMDECCATAGCGFTGLGCLPAQRLESNGGRNICPSSNLSGVGSTGGEAEPDGQGGCALTQYWSKTDKECKAGDITDEAICSFAAKCADAHRR